MGIKFNPDVLGDVHIAHIDLILFCVTLIIDAVTSTLTYPVVMR